MYILSQVNKETIWGSRELIAYGADPALDKVGSLYTLAANEELSCKVLNGPNAGRRLYDVYRENPQAFGMGAGESFPLIISFISACEDLSIQIHPDDAYARRVENKPFGKSESWFFLRKPASGAIAMGCKCKSRQELEEKVEKGLWDQVVDHLAVQEDSYVYVTPGTLHALTAGCIAYEIQQATDVTYRFYDYDRVDSAGNKRPLQLKQAMDVVQVEKKSKAQRFGHTPHIEKEYAIERVNLEGGYVNGLSRFVCLTLLQGELYLEGHAVKKGTSVLVLPGEEIAFGGKAQAVCAFSRL